jgi:acyl homoserine lactone synthase
MAAVPLLFNPVTQAILGVARMATVEMGTCRQLSARLVSRMHEFRYDVFVRRLKWSLPLPNGVEQDQYDTPDARYVIISDESGRVTACARLLPTTETYMLPELFPQLLGGVATPKDPAIWELSRFATSVRETREGRILSLSKPTLDFLDLIFDFARRNGIARLLFVTTVSIERLMLRAGLPVHRMGPPAIVDGHPTVALFIEMRQKAAELSTDCVLAEAECSDFIQVPA